jgi:hypothetical protein
MTTDERRLHALGRIVRDGVDETVTPEHDAAEQARFIEAVQKPERSSRRWWAAGLAFAAAIAIVGFFLWPRTPIAYTVDGARVAPGGYVSASGTASATVRFSDGSVASLAAGSGARIVDVTARGARIVLEEGRADLEIAARPGARWSVEAGPYVVAVTGTRFGVLWTRGEQTFELRLLEGSVVVRGPLVEEGVSLRKGQVLVADTRSGRLSFGELAADSTLGAATATALGDAAPSATPAAAAPGQPSATTEPATPATSAPLSWSKRVAMGDHQGVLADAEQMGIDSVMEQGSLEQVAALGDAARYGKRGDIARKALAALRRRFPASAQGRSAAFLLGRLADDGGSPGAAIAWYETYLSESPGGTFATEALGRRMWAVSRTRGKEAARPLAEDYLRRHSSGPHAAIARSILAP